MKYLLAGIFFLLSWHKITAQSTVSLENCGVSYIDPQDAIVKDAPSHDTVTYTSYFAEQNVLRAYYVDINAFGGQQVDQARVFGILPDGSFQLLGRLSFGNCVDCVKGFALVLNDSLLVKQVNDRNTMDLWLQSLSQPPFALTSNLQTLTGVGRISGTLPPCAKGIFIQFIVYSNPNSTSTEFSTHILCPEIIRPCQIEAKAEVDCQKDSLFLSAVIPSDCFSPDARVFWRNESGWERSALKASLPLTGNEGRYYFTVEDAYCSVVDSILVENPSFAEAGSDQAVCRGDEVILQGAGGETYYWEQSDGDTFEGAVLRFPAAEVLQSGAYILHAFNEQGCEDTDTLRLDVQVAPDPVVLVSDACLGDTLWLSLQNDTDFAAVDWFNQLNIRLAPPFISNLKESDFGEYHVTATGLNGCLASRSFPVRGSLPPAFSFTIEESCDSARVYLFPEAYQYEWDTGAKGSSFSTGTGGVFQLTITDSLGCRTRETIEVPRPDGPEVTLTVENPPCPNDFGAIELSLADPDLPAVFSIDGGQNYTLNPRFEALPAGAYEILVQDELGCIQTIAATINAPDTMAVELDLTHLEVRPGTPVRLEAKTIGNIQRLQWLPQMIDTGNPVTEFIANENIDIRVVVEDERGCLASDGFPLTIVLGDIYVPNAFSPDGDRSNERFVLYSDNGSGEIIEFLRIFDRYGTLLFDVGEVPLNSEAHGWDGSYRGKPMNTGVYVYHALIRFGNGARKELMGDVTLLR